MEFSEIKGFGSKRIQILKENGIVNVNDLLTVFPYKYLDLTATVAPGEAKSGDCALIACRVSAPAVCRYLRKGLFITVVTMNHAAGNEQFECSWFNQKYLRNRLKPDKEFYVCGTAERYGKKLTLKNPVLIENTDSLSPVVPLYRPIKGIPAKLLSEAIGVVLERVRVGSYLDDEIIEKYGLLDLNEAFRHIHRPRNLSQAEEARNCLAVENLSCNIALYSLLKKSGNKIFNYSDRERFYSFTRRLPFKLTDDQQKALSEILSDMNGPKKMNRLLQGDVGCGKTIVALLCMYYAALSGLQSVLMSPTELLARQHYETACRLFEGQGVKIVFLSSSLGTAQRQYVLAAASGGEADMIIGTHSLIQRDVEFSKLSLIVTDEQQRFGVKQRGALENKAINADYLVMTATPIPRTLALTLYGDLEQSAIRELPAKKATVNTSYVPKHKTSGMLKYVTEKAAAGEQTYMVCPRIDDDSLVSVVKLYEKLMKTSLKPYLGVLHGQMSDEEKDGAMSDFAAGKTKVLITTSIIEVGIDVPAATTIIIFNAEYYGLSQLHQLRGRVGRGEKESYCFILTDSLSGERAKERLDRFISCKDGFLLAEYDFNLRGAGDFLGTRQHGDSFLSDINKPLIDKAKAIADYLAGSENFRQKIINGAQKGSLLIIKNLTMN